MLPSILAKQLEKGIGDYIETTFPMTNKPFQGSVRKMLDSKDAVWREPYVSVRLPFRLAEDWESPFQAVPVGFVPFVHQQTAFERLTGEDGRSTLIATGTGSGKTECFQYPVLEYCYRNRGKRGIKALIIYPMNALASDQAERIAKKIHNSPLLRGNVTVGMYVGGFDGTPTTMMGEKTVITDHEALISNPPDILMTNYKMLDYLLVRPKDANLWKDNDSDTLKYIAVDEFHTFDGAQGTDLACLLRRLKSRLGIRDGYLCCVGTSATMGTDESRDAILTYASKVFGEPFDQDAIITEDRLSPSEFFAEQEITDFTMPPAAKIEELNRLTEQDDQDAFLRAAVKAWTDLEDVDILTEEGRYELGRHLMHHSFMQAMITLMKGNYFQVSRIIDELSVPFPGLKESGDPEMAVNALLALISHARVPTMRPFLNVQVQLWMRELRRLMAKVSGSEISYAIARDMNAQQAKAYLPVVNCRDCGETGWTTILNERQNASIGNPDTFYNRFFKGDEKVVMMFPHAHMEVPFGMIGGRICPNCLQVKVGEDSPNTCESCGTAMVDIVMPGSVRANKGQYVCPFCGSRRGLSMMGIRSATEISTELSQLFASKFNDDKKTLAFSDNVQDAAHRAGFFNARTWRFGFRTAVQRYVQNGGAGQSLNAFTRGFLQYWHEHMSNESFVSYFIAPNMTWMRAYEEMIERRKFGNDALAKRLMEDIEKRLSYEIMLEYGLTAKLGRTLEKSGCSCLAFPADLVSSAAEAAWERAYNEIGGLAHTGQDSFEQMVAGYLRIMAQNGAFDDEAFIAYHKGGGKSYLLSNDHVNWMPGQQAGRNIPRFLYRQKIPGQHNHNYDTTSDKKYTDWIEACCNEEVADRFTYAGISQIILEELVKIGLVKEIQAVSEHTVFALNKDAVLLTDRVVQMKCGSCGTLAAVAEDNRRFWENAPCLRSACGGLLKQSEKSELDYYGKLFSSGDLARINAREHTGLLERNDREALEADFKRKKDTKQFWDPNVLTCTPTLEMGIDIGDLSTVILCSMPPAQAQFLQRTGRAGRKDGNALTLAVAAAKPHDLYFYSDPMDMMEGEVAPPKIFLDASAILERQFVAYCMDNWVKKEATEQSIPKNVGIVLGKLDSHPADLFPFNFLHYVQNNLNYLQNSFIALFAKELDKSAEKELRLFAKGDRLKESPMHVKILEAFQGLKKQRDSVSGSIKDLRAMVRELESKPKDSSYDAEIKDLKAEQAALINVVRGINTKNIFNFLSDEGLLPNYAFPETGIVLKAILYRRDENTEDIRDKKKIRKSVYEYSRAASSAISEFAPNNSFYVDGRKLTIDQIDLSSSQTAKWRLCPNCSHARIEETGKFTASCPQCGSPGWADAGQLRNMLKVQMVYSNTDYTKSLISDESDDRTNVFYCKQMLVDVDEEHDIASAYQMKNDEFDFGYEFVKKATLREINFGESDIVGERMTVSGVEDVRKGFKICKFCGKVQPDNGKANHSFYCKTRKMLSLTEDPYEEFLFLYREFVTEALRILIPATSMDATSVRTETFTAAFMLGMREKFGNVDHLRATVSEVPVPDADFRKKYLVIYDSVPGGTGYLKQLMNEKNSLIDIFEKALLKLEQCSCKEDPQKDGCYHCLYAYRQSQNIGSISRSTAIRMLKAILSGKGNLTKIDRLGRISVNLLFDSELERRFVEAVSQMGNDRRTIEISKSLVNDKEGYVLKVNSSLWEIEPQVVLDSSCGVAVTCKPDFIIRPIGAGGRLPVAVFTDGFQFHKDKVADDTLKREAIRRSGRYRVWTLSWKDVQTVFQDQGDYMTATLAYAGMPSGARMYQPTIRAAGAEALTPGSMKPMELLMQYLDNEDADRLFAAHARAVSLSLLEPTQMANSLAFAGWKEKAERINDQLNCTDAVFVQPGTIFGSWTPRSSDAHFSAYAGILSAAMQANREAPVTVWALLDDRADSRTDRYEEEWNGFWKFFNVMQFAGQFAAASASGLEDRVYDVLTVGQPGFDAEDTTPAQTEDSGWKEIRDYLYDDITRQIAETLENKGVKAPDEAGYELAESNGEVVAEMELVWLGRKIAYMTEEQEENRGKAEASGWKIFTSEEEIDTVFQLEG